MKGEGPRHERETIIRFDEESNEAPVWTASGTTYRRLKKLGYAPIENRSRSATFRMPKRDMKLPRPKREMTDAVKESLRKARLRSRAPVATGVQPPKDGERL